MKKAQEQVRKTQSPVQLGGYLAWLQDEADPEALAYLSKAIPRPILAVFSQLLGRRYRQQIASVWAA